MNFYIPIGLIVFFAIILGLIIGYFMAWLSLKPTKPKKTVLYNGNFGNGYKSQASPPKRGFYKRPAPPKPDYNPNK